MKFAIWTAFILVSLSTITAVHSEEPTALYKLSKILNGGTTPEAMQAMLDPVMQHFGETPPFSDELYLRWGDVLVTMQQDTPGLPIDGELKCMGNLPTNIKFAVASALCASMFQTGSWH